MKKILVVEDSKQIREEIRDILAQENFNVYEASNGYEGLEVTFNHFPDLIISDISMPELDGYGFLTELKKLSRTENIPFIFLSAKTDLKDIRKGMNMGAQDYLTKPLSPDDLIVAINNKLAIKTKTDQKLNSFKYQVVQYLPHELITPLNGILGFSEYLRNSYPNCEKDILQIADSIHTSGERLLRLIQNYLLYTKLYVELNASKSNWPEEQIFISGNDFKDLVSKYLNNDRKDDFTLEVEDACININSEFLIKIVEELIGNSIKFSKPGDKIAIFSNNEQNNYLLKVESIGKGISPEQIEEIGLFMQFDRKINEQQGMGLGLEIVRMITKLYKGEFKVESRPHEYFRVLVTLPK